MLTYLSDIAFVVLFAAFLKIVQEVLNIGPTLICCSSSPQGRTVEFSGEFRSKSLVDFSKFVFAGPLFMVSVQSGIDIESVPHCMSKVHSAKTILLLEFSNLAFTSWICSTFGLTISSITVSFSLCHPCGSFTICPIL